MRPQDVVFNQAPVEAERRRGLYPLPRQPPWLVGIVLSLLESSGVIKCHQVSIINHQTASKKMDADMNQGKLSLHLPHERATFYFHSEKQMKRFISDHVRTGKDGLPHLHETGIKYKYYADL